MKYKISFEIEGDLCDEVKDKPLQDVINFIKEGFPDEEGFSNLKVEEVSEPASIVCPGCDGSLECTNCGDPRRPVMEFKDWFLENYPDSHEHSDFRFDMEKAWTAAREQGSTPICSNLLCDYCTSRDTRYDCETDCVFEGRKLFSLDEAKTEGNEDDQET
jgi:hypothetical protein